MDEHLCKHGNYHCMTCEVVLLKKVIDDMQEERTQIIACVAKENAELAEIIVRSFKGG